MRTARDETQKQLTVLSVSDKQDALLQRHKRFYRKLQDADLLDPNLNDTSAVIEYRVLIKPKQSQALDTLRRCFQHCTYLS